MDDEGIAAEVIFPGGENGEVLPFVGWGLGASGDEGGKELRDEGIRIYNRWLSDFISGNPHRHVGVMLIPIEDVDAAVREMEWGRNHGLTAVNFPAPRRDFPAYNDERYEPFWSACEDLNLPLCTHRGGGELALGLLGPAGMAIQHAEGQWMSRRALWQMIFSGVFERHPGLAFILTEAGTHWLPFTLSDLDSIYTCQANAWLRKELPRSPSEYWAEHCYLSGSFLARFELEMALQGEISPENLMWGADYPHVESTWPDTRAHLRFTFSGAPESVTRRVLGDNAIRVFGLDREQLAQVAEKVGPAVAEVDEPLEQLPERRYLAFRTRGSWG
jgi:predicted TIM-barrel fold metal-dependent hydrolase